VAPFARIRTKQMQSGCGFLGCRHGGAELLKETLRVLGGKGLDTLGRGGLHEDAGVVMLMEALDDLRIGVGGGVGLLLAGEQMMLPAWPWLIFGSE